MNKFTCLALVALAALQLGTQGVASQSSDGDDQFQAYHGDIGRISGSSSLPAVAQQTTIVRQPAAAEPQQQQQQQHQTEPPVRSRTQRPQQVAARKPNRVTLAVRTQGPVSAVALGEPAPFRPLVLSAPATTLPSHLVEPSAASQLAAPTSYQFQQVGKPTSAQSQDFGPALSSFRSNLGHTNSVSARHSALMAQVAAERQAAANIASQAAETLLPTAQFAPSPVGQPQQASLGSPLEALSSPAVSQVQPPPTLHHQHQQQQLGSRPAESAPSFQIEPEAAPSLEHVLGQGCPNKGVFSYENRDYCDRYYMCTNGTFTEEACPNGLSYSQMGAVYQHCAYNWNVDCGRKKTTEPLASPGCPWQFGIFPIQAAGRCSIDYFVCEWGVPETKRCSPEGLFYDDRIKGCQWADQLGCKSEGLLNFKCPSEDENNPYWPYPRYYHTNQDIIVCVNEQPRLVHCNEDQKVEPSSLACIDLHKKKKQAHQFH